MARFVHIDYPAQHGGVTRVEHAVDTLRGYSAGYALQVVLRGLALVGAPIVRLASHIGAGLAVWREARKQRAEDEKLWNLALTDARIMADLSRAMSRDALRDSRGYY